MDKTKVLVVDDAALIRKVLSDMLSAAPGVEVVGTAANGKLALDKIPLVNPDIITLDVEMPEMDGIAALREVRKRFPKIPVIMVSGHTERGAAVTLEALALGAADYITKPSSGSGREEMGKELVAKILALCRKPNTTKLRPSAVTTAPRARVTAKPAVLAIGVSTGGPVALSELMPRLPADLNVPILVTQHMPAVFTKILAERLAKVCPFSVVEAAHGVSVEANVAYIAPGDFHLELGRDGGRLVVNLTQGPREHHCRPAVDVMLRSIVREFGPDVLSVILTGMGFDGTKGCEVVRAAGGIVLAQDEASSVVWGMPGSVANAGLADEIVGLSNLPERITGLLRRPSSTIREQRSVAS